MANELKMAIVNTITELPEKGWKQRRIARELGVNRETVARYARLRLEAGPKPANPTLGSEGPPSPKGRSRTASNMFRTTRSKVGPLKALSNRTLSSPIGNPRSQTPASTAPRASKSGNSLRSRGLPYRSCLRSLFRFSMKVGAAFIGTVTSKWPRPITPFLRNISVTSFGLAGICGWYEFTTQNSIKWQSIAACFREGSTP